MRLLLPLLLLPAGCPAFVAEPSVDVEVVPPAPIAFRAGPASTCVDGGERLHAGVDQNANGALEEAEGGVFVDVCTGPRGADAPELRFDVVDATPAECERGGRALLLVDGADVAVARVPLCTSAVAGRTLLSDLRCTTGETAVLSSSDTWTCRALPVVGDNVIAADQLCPPLTSVVGSDEQGRVQCALDDDAFEEVRGLCEPFQLLHKAADGSFFCAFDDVLPDVADTLGALRCDDDRVPVRTAGGAYACVSFADSDVFASNCADDEFSFFDGASFSCRSLTSTDTLLSLTCADGQRPVSLGEGLGWGCGDDVDLDQDLARALACPPGATFKATASGSWACAVDVDDAADSDELGALTCAPGQTVKRRGNGAWACDNDEDTDSDTARDILAACPEGQVIGRVDGRFECRPDTPGSIDNLGCAQGQVLRRTTTGFACTADNDTNSDTLAGVSGCLPNQLLKKQANGSWQCENDVDTDSDVIGALSCADGDVVAVAANGFVCASDADSDLAAGLGATCGDGQLARRAGDTWVCSDDDDDDLLRDIAALCGAGDIPHRVGSTWVCQPDRDVDDVDTDVLLALSTVCVDGEVPIAANGSFVCGDAASAGNADTLRDIACQPGEIPKSLGGDWRCASDDDGGVAVPAGFIPLRNDGQAANLLRAGGRFFISETVVLSESIDAAVSIELAGPDSDVAALVFEPSVTMLLSGALSLQNVALSMEPDADDNNPIITDAFACKDSVVTSLRPEGALISTNLVDLDGCTVAQTSNESPAIETSDASIRRSSVLAAREALLIFGGGNVTITDSTSSGFFVADATSFVVDGLTSTGPMSVLSGTATIRGLRADGAEPFFVRDADVTISDSDLELTAITPSALLDVRTRISSSSPAGSA